VFSGVEHSLDQVRIVTLDEAVAVDSILRLKLPIFFRHFIIFLDYLLFSAEYLKVLLIYVTAWLPRIVVVVIVSLRLLTEPRK
jgi:hypothetical protein